MTHPTCSARQLLDADTHTPDESTVVVTVRGEIDLWTLPVLEKLLARHACTQRLVVDLSSVQFCDIAGVRCLRDASRRALAAGRLFEVVPSRWLARLLALTGYDNTVRQLPQSDRPRPTAGSERAPTR